METNLWESFDAPGFSYYSLVENAPACDHAVNHINACCWMDLWGTCDDIRCIFTQTFFANNPIIGNGKNNTLNNGQHEQIILPIRVIVVDASVMHLFGEKMEEVHRQSMKKEYKT